MSKLRVAWLVLLPGLFLPGPAGAVEAAPALTDREIVERLARLEKGQTGLRTDLKQLREDMNRQNEQLRADMQQLREDLNRQNEQLRTDIGQQMQQLREEMTGQFAQQFHLTLALLAAFSTLVAAILGFALWDRRTMLRPFERSVRSLEEDIGNNRRRLDALVEALRALGQHNPEVAGVLRQFHLR